MRVPDAAQIVREAKEALEASTDKRLAYLLWRDYGVETDQPRVSRWRRGLGEPRYAATVALLHAAGWLNEDQIQKAEGLAAAASREAAGVEEETRPLEQPSQEHPQSETG